MKLLLLMRHAKSSWDDPGLEDFDRPLNPRGQQDAPRMGALLKKKKLIPELIIASPAVRVKQTLQRFTAACGYPGKIEWNEHFYGADPAAYIDGLTSAPDSCQKIMIVGHNPGLERLLAQLIGRREKFPTAALACLGLEIDAWRDLSLKTPAQLQHLWRPKEI